MKKRDSFTEAAAETVAIQALTYIAADAERLGGFLSLTGIGPDQIRAAARTPGFLAGVLDHIVADEALLVGFAAAADLKPEHVVRARAALGSADWERELP
ncbi:MAG TPA: DUF3572 domain-containing protein [Pseudolabrys sp.]|nr:DUF3572 domain-containing protein [Pseudolabrys sp.]